MSILNLPAHDCVRISGYASLFGQVDLSGDVVKSGAFSASILSLGPHALPMLFGHKTQNPIGVWDRIVEDRTGLFVSGRIIPGAEPANRTARLVREGALTGLSIGYRATRASPRMGARNNAMGRDLLELDLWEVSVVAFPMLRDARITQVDDMSQSLNLSPSQRSTV